MAKKSKSKSTTKKSKPKKKKGPSLIEKPKKPPKNQFKALIYNLKTNPKHQIIALFSAIFLIIALAACALFVLPEKNLFNKDRYNIDVNEYRDNTDQEKPLTMPRRIDGVVVATEDANLVPACVMIENAAFAGVRPQSGLQAASLIYELIVEGGITRLMAVYAGEQTDPVGPVRSARDTYLEFAAEIDCMYVHAGGSFTAMLALYEKDYKDLDGLREPKYFWRDSSKSSPHNFFTNTKNLYEAIIEGHSWTEDSTYDSWLFEDDKDDRLNSGDEGYISEVNIYFGGAYDVQYKYNQDNNYYERFNGGVEHIDNNTGKILTTRNIIIQKVGLGWQIEGKGRINFPVTGEGEVAIFREGEVVQGTWKKPDRLSRTKFYDQDGNEISLVRGNSWVEIVPEDRNFDWK